MRILLLGMAMLLAACSRGGGDENLGAASGNSLTSAQIDAALGPANQQQSLGNEMSAAANASDSGGTEDQKADPQTSRESRSTQLNAETSSSSR